MGAWVTWLKCRRHAGRSPEAPTRSQGEPLDFKNRYNLKNYELTEGLGCFPGVGYIVQVSLDPIQGKLYPYLPAQPLSSQAEIFSNAELCLN